MDPDHIFTGSQPGQPLYAVSPERVNRQQYDLNSSPKSHSRDSSVSQMAAKFDTLAFQGKALERKANDAALKRAMLGREEAEGEMRRYREESRLLKKQVDDLGAKCGKFEDRHMALMEKYSRTKETHQHTEKLWNDQIRRSRKEAFKASSMVVKLQEELKSSRSAHKMAQADFDVERDRSSKREQEAFAARYQLVGVQQELEALREAVKLVEQERDALRTIAKNEEVARIAAEGRIPLPISKDDDEFASPRRASKQLAPVTVLSSAASEEEIESLRWEVKLERQRAERAFDHAEFLKMECHFGRCTCKLSEKNGQSFVHLSAQASQDQSKAMVSAVQHVKPEHEDFDLYKIAPHPGSQGSDARDASRKLQHAIFVSEASTFQAAEEPVPQSSPWISPARSHAHTLPIPPVHKQDSEVEKAPVMNVSVPYQSSSVVHMSESNTSLMSLLDEPQTQDKASHDADNDDEDDGEHTILHHSTIAEAGLPEAETYTELETQAPAPSHTLHSQSAPIHSNEDPVSAIASPQRTFHTISTTIRIPVFAADDDEENDDSNTGPAAHPAGPRPAPASASSKHIQLQQPSFNTKDSALSPTMTREEALAMIRERRGRARSMAAGMATPRKGLVEGAAGQRRDISAPAVRSAGRSASRGRGLLARS